MSRLCVRLRIAGFTLIELMVVIAIVAVVLLLAAPSFRKTIEMQRLRGVQDELLTSIQLARTEAVARNVPVHIRIRPAGDSSGACYTIFADSNKSIESWSVACDCRAAAGLRCTAASTSEIKTVILNSAHGIDFTLATALDDRFAFDPTFAGLIVAQSEDRAKNLAAGFSVNAGIDSQRMIRTTVTVPGRAQMCAPSGSTVPISSC